MKKYLTVGVLVGLSILLFLMSNGNNPSKINSDNLDSEAKAHLSSEKLSQEWKLHFEDIRFEEVVPMVNAELSRIEGKEYSIDLISDSVGERIVSANRTGTGKEELLQFVSNLGHCEVSGTSEEHRIEICSMME